jgi:hypothetical protein
MAQSTAKQQLANMVPTGAQHHYGAAERHENAIEHHREAARNGRVSSWSPFSIRKRFKRFLQWLELPGGGAGW